MSAKDDIERLENSIEREFEDVMDYIWKSPRLIEHETKLEKEKLTVYFPNHPQLAKLRWAHETHKLRRVFPFLVTSGNLFCIVSLFESYLLMLVECLERMGNVKLDSVSGNGLNRVIKYLRRIGLHPEGKELFPQVQAIIKIRNCLAHASGLLSWSKEEAELRRIQRSATYLSTMHRKMRKDLGRSPDEVQIVSSALGDRIQIKNEYAFVSGMYLREYLLQLCQEARQVGSA